MCDNKAVIVVALFFILFTFQHTVEAKGSRVYSIYRISHNDDETQSQPNYATQPHETFDTPFQPSASAHEAAVAFASSFENGRKPNVFEQIGLDLLRKQHLLPEHVVHHSNHNSSNDKEGNKITATPVGQVTTITQAEAQTNRTLLPQAVVSENANQSLNRTIPAVNDASVYQNPGSPQITPIAPLQDISINNIKVEKIAFLSEPTENLQASEILSNTTVKQLPDVTPAIGTDQSQNLPSETLTSIDELNKQKVRKVTPT